MSTLKAIKNTLKEVKARIKSQKKLIGSLKSQLNSKLVEIDSKIYEKPYCIYFNFKNGFKVLVISDDYKKPIKLKNLLVIHDKDFKLLTKFVKGKLPSVQEDGSLYLKNVLTPFLKSQSSKSKAKLNYKKLYYYETKDLLNQEYKLKTKPENEFFLFGDDEISPRFIENSKILHIPKKGVKVQIQDSSALIFEKPNSRYVDLYVGTGYLSKDYLYTSQDITVYKKSKKGDVAMFDPKTNKLNHFKIVLKSGVDLSKEPKVKYKKGNDLVFNLKKENGVYFLEDKKGKIEIYHPDLLVRVVE